jgi:hypothetical protein
MDQCASCDPVVGIEPSKRAVVFLSNDLGHQSLVAFFFPVAER